ncbi:MAG: DUF3237 domain-containing protein [Acidimicrobiia bacterium]
MSIELVPLATMSVVLRAPLMLDGTPVGSRWIFEVESGVIEGERINAKMKGQSSADWFVIGPEGTGTLDVRALAETDDGALVFIQYNGRVDLSTGTPGPTYAAPRFETGDARYAWLNKIQSVAKGRLDGSNLVYEIYEVR